MNIVVDSAVIGEKLRLFLSDSRVIDVWLPRMLQERFGFHWERRHLDGTIYRYDNFPDVAWNFTSAYPRHFHNGSQQTVESAPFSPNLERGFREFLRFAMQKMSK